MINTRLVYASISLSGTILLLVILFPNIDIEFSELFYNDSEGFSYSNNVLVKLCFIIIPILTITLGIVTLLYLLYFIIKDKTFNKIIFSWVCYIILSIAIGPGLLVNHIFKENFGRARPAQITNFNGPKNFTKAFWISNECEHNCSFSSGHAAMGYSFTCLAYVFPPIFFSRIYSSALILGSLVGISRILMGGHFFTDVLASCFVVLIINHLLYLCWQRLRSI